MKILVVGPSPDKSKGGMATVISEIREDAQLNSHFNIDIFESYIDGEKAKRIIYSILAFINFFLTKRNYDIYHIHVASRGSTFRKKYYIHTVKKWGKKAILHIHGAQYMEFYNELSDRKKQDVIHMLNIADMVIALSQDWKNKFESAFGLENCVVLENGINVDKLSPAISEPAKYQRCFLTLGKLGKRKGTYDLVNAIEIAIKLIPDIVLYLAGDGDVEKIKRLVINKKLDGNIKVVGWADFNKKLDLLKQVSTVVLPSYNEGLPMSVLEGMACGKAIISTTVGAIPEVITKDNGLLIEAGDINALTNALIKCSTDICMLKDMSDSNIKKIEEGYSMKIMHRKLAEYYNYVYEK